MQKTDEGRASRLWVGCAVLDHSPPVRTILHYKWFAAASQCTELCFAILLMVDVKCMMFDC